MSQTIVVATDGSETGKQASGCTVEFAAKLDRVVHIFHMTDPGMPAGGILASCGIRFRQRVEISQGWIYSNR